METIESLVTSSRPIPSANSSNTLGSVIQRVKSGSDAIFVFDSSKKNLFLGIVSPSYCLFKRRFPAATKLEHCLLIPPRIESSVSIFDVARHMIALGVYTLPVFDRNDKIIGVINGRSILKRLAFDKALLSYIKKMIIISRPITASSFASVGEVYSKLKKEKNSRVIIVNEIGKLEGILTRRDIQNAFIAPSTGLRKGTNPGRLIHGVGFNEKEITRFDFPVSEFYKREVVTVDKKANISEMIKIMLDKRVNSIVLVDRLNRPVGIVSVRSFLSALSESKPEVETKITMSDRHNLLSRDEKTTVENILERFFKKQERIMPIQSMEFFLEAAKSPKGKVISYEVSIFMHVVNGGKFGTKVSDKKLILCVKNALRKIESQRG